jgi:hypothetical protein
MTPSALTHQRHDQLREVAKHLALMIRRRQQADSVDPATRHLVDFVRNLIGLADQAARPDRFRLYEFTLARLEVRAMAVVDLPEARLLGQAEIIDAIQILLPNVLEVRRN